MKPHCAISKTQQKIQNTELRKDPGVESCLAHSSSPGSHLQLPQLGHRSAPHRDGLCSSVHSEPGITTHQAHTHPQTLHPPQGGICW